MRLKNILFLILFLPVALFAQIDKSEVRSGNRGFKKQDYKEAEIDYRRALVKDSTSLAANYNLANTLYRLNDMEQAMKMLERVKDSAPVSDYAADYGYNMGNVAVNAKNWQAAVDSYKASLLKNPGDIEAKENYIYAKKKLEEQQKQDQNKDQNQDNKDQNKDQNKDDKQDQDNKDKNEDNKDQNKDKDQNGNQDKNKDQQQQQGQQPKISPQAAQQMLQAIQAKEKETQGKVKEKKAAAAASRQKEKNW